jgi:hypothetical protein
MKRSGAGPSCEGIGNAAVKTCDLEPIPWEYQPFDIRFAQNATGAAFTLRGRFVAIRWIFLARNRNCLALDNKTCMHAFG